MSWHDAIPDFPFHFHGTIQSLQDDPRQPFRWPSYPDSAHQGRSQARDASSIGRVTSTALQIETLSKCHRLQLPGAQWHNAQSEFIAGPSKSRPAPHTSFPQWVLLTDGTVREYLRRRLENGRNKVRTGRHALHALKHRHLLPGVVITARFRQSQYF